MTGTGATPDDPSAHPHAPCHALPLSPSYYVTLPRPPSPTGSEALPRTRDRPRAGSRARGPTRVGLGAGRRGFPEQGVCAYAHARATPRVPRPTPRDGRPDPGAPLRAGVTAFLCVRAAPRVHGARPWAQGDGRRRGGRPSRRVGVGAEHGRGAGAGGAAAGARVSW